MKNTFSAIKATLTALEDDTTYWAGKFNIINAFIPGWFTLVRLPR